MPEFSAKNFCDGLEMKFASPSAGIQQTGAPETAAKPLSFYFRLVITSAYIQVCISLSPLPHGA